MAARSYSSGGWVPPLACGKCEWVEERRMCDAEDRMVLSRPCEAHGTSIAISRLKAEVLHLEDANNFLGLALGVANEELAKADVAAPATWLPVPDLNLAVPMQPPPDRSWVTTEFLTDAIRTGRVVSVNGVRVDGAGDPVVKKSHMLSNAFWKFLPVLGMIASFVVPVPLGPSLFTLCFFTWVVGLFG